MPFVWPQNSPVTGLNGPPAPTKHDSFRQIVPQACLVPVLATSAGQVVRRVPGLGRTCPGAPADPSQLGPEGSLQQQPFSEEWQFHAAPRRPSCAPAGPGWARPAGTHPLSPAGPTLAHPASSACRDPVRSGCAWGLHWPRRSYVRWSTLTLGVVLVWPRQYELPVVRIDSLGAA